MRWKIYLPPGDGLVDRLAPPGDPEQVAEQLIKIRVSWAEAVTRERLDDQDLGSTRRQLEVVRRACQGLGPRALNAFAEALATGELRHPEDDIRIGKATGLIDGWGLYSALNKAIEQALATLEKRKSGRRGNLSNLTRQAVRALVDLFCECRGAQRPYFDTTESIVRRNEALVFAHQCLNAWGDQDVKMLEADDLFWSL